jgi:hypothetical protein
MIVDKDATSGGTASVTLSAGTETVAHVLNLTAPTLTSTAGIAIQGAAVDRSGYFTTGPPATMTGSGGRFTIPVHAGSGWRPLRLLPAVTPRFRWTGRDE